MGKFCCCLFCEAEGGEDSSRWVAAEEGPSLNTVAGGPGLCTGTEPGDVWLEAAGLGRTSNLAAVSIRTGNKLSRLKFHNNGEGLHGAFSVIVKTLWTSNLASWLKKVLGGGWGWPPNTDCKDRGCSGARKLLKLTNGDEEEEADC